MNSEAKALNRIRDLIPLMVAFFRDPVSVIKEPVRLSWPAAFALQFVFAMISGSVNALINQSVVDFIVSLVVFPIAVAMIGAVFTLFLYYFFSVTQHTYLDIRRLHSLSVLATVPYFIVHAIASFLPPLDLIGFALTCILLTVGLSEQFGLARRPVMILTGVLYAIFFVAWSAIQVAIT